MQFAKEVSAAPAGSDVIIEATYGWYWAADLLDEIGYVVHLANPHGNDWGHRRVKNDERDAQGPGRPACASDVSPRRGSHRPRPESSASWSASATSSATCAPGSRPRPTRCMAKNGILPCTRRHVGPGRCSAQFDPSSSPTPIQPHRGAAGPRRALSTARSASWTATSTASFATMPATTPSRPSMASARSSRPIFVAEIGDVTRFDSPKALCSWAGLTPKHRESDTHVHRGRITKQGSRLVRWAAIEAVARYHGGDPFRGKFEAIAERRGKTKANVAIARRVLTLVYYGLRDGEIRCLAGQEAA